MAKCGTRLLAMTSGLLSFGWLRASRHKDLSDSKVGELVAQLLHASVGGIGDERGDDTFLASKGKCPKSGGHDVNRRAFSYEVRPQIACLGRIVVNDKDIEVRELAHVGYPRA